MITNPLDWPAGPFLILYAVVAGLSGLAIALVRRMIGGPPNQYQSHDLGVLELAWLSGGRERAADAVMVSLLNAGAASVEANKWFVVHALDATALPNEILAFWHSAAATSTRRRFHRSIRRQLEPVREALVVSGLAPGPSDTVTIWLATLSLVLIPVLLGLAKIEEGMFHRRPIDLLLMMVIATVVFAIASLFNQPHRTRRGRAAVERAKSSFARAVRAPLGSEIPLAFAVSGAVVLDGTHCQAFRKLMPSGGGGGGGGGCGGGCGGCGGGGGD